MTFCPMPFTHLNIKQEGKVSACWRFPDKLGDYRTQKLQDIWNGNEVKQVRNDLLNGVQNNGCRSCWDMEKSGSVSTRQQCSQTFPYVNEKFVKENSLQQHVKITGWVDSNQIKSMLANSDAMLLPSFAEGLPVAIMEAMATGVPVISTSIAGIPELLVHNETGFLVCPGSVSALETALNDFTKIDAEKLKSVKLAAFNAVSKEHNASTEAAKLAAFVSEES